MLPNAFLIREKKLIISTTSVNDGVTVIFADSYEHLSANTGSSGFFKTLYFPLAKSRRDIRQRFGQFY